jgi:hypothetical protein
MSWDGIMNVSINMIMKWKKKWGMDELMVGRSENLEGYGLIDSIFVLNYMCLTCKMKKQI